MTYTEDRETFERMIAGQIHHLRDVTADFVTGMTSVDKDAFLRIAIEAAWDHREEFKPVPGYGLPQYWKRCLKYAATSRDKWRVNAYVLPGVLGEWKWVKGSQLGKQS